MCPLTRFLWGAGGRSVTTGWMHLGISMSLHLRTAADDDDDSSSGSRSWNWSRSKSRSSTVATAAYSQICVLADCRLGRHALRLCALAVFSSFRPSPILPNLVHSRPPSPLLLLRSYLLISPSSVLHPAAASGCLCCCYCWLLLCAAVHCCVPLAAAPPRPNTAFVAWPWPRGTGLRQD